MSFLLYRFILYYLPTKIEESEWKKKKKGKIASSNQGI
jgi:hypothetical protein